MKYPAYPQYKDSGVAWLSCRGEKFFAPTGNDNTERLKHSAVEWLGEIPVNVGWIEQLRLEKHTSETQRQAMKLLGFIAFNPAYKLENSVIKDSLTTAAAGKVCRVDKRSASTFQLEKGGRQ